MSEVLKYIEWEDSYSVNTGWNDIEEILEHFENEILIIKQVGYVIKETDEYIILCNQLNHTCDGNRYSGVHRVPKPLIKKEEIISFSS